VNEPDICWIGNSTYAPGCAKISSLIYDNSIGYREFMKSNDHRAHTRLDRIIKIFNHYYNIEHGL